MAEWSPTTYITGARDAYGGDLDAMEQSARDLALEGVEWKSTLSVVDRFLAEPGDADEALVVFAQGWRDRLAGIVGPPPEGVEL